MSLKRLFRSANASFDNEGIEANNEALCHPARRMKDLVELGDLRSGILRDVFDFEKREVFLRNEPELEQAQLLVLGMLSRECKFRLNGNQVLENFAHMANGQRIMSFVLNESRFAIRERHSLR